MTARGTAALLAATLALLLVAPAAAAQDRGGAGAAALHLELVRIDGTVHAEGALRLRLRVANRSDQDREGLRVVATLHRRTTSRFEYQQALDGGVVGTVVHGFAADVGPVPAHGARTVELRQDADDLGFARMDGLEGVYPLRVQLLQAGEVLDELITCVVAAARATARPLDVALMMTVASGPARDASGRFTEHGIVGDVAGGGAVAGVAAALTAHPDVPVTVAADAHALEEVADLADGAPLAWPGGDLPPDAREAVTRRAGATLAGLRAALTRPHVEVVALPYASADLVALVRGGLGGEAARHLTDGVRAVEALTGVRPDDQVLVPPDGITAEALTHALAAGARTVVLTSDYLRGPDVVRLTPSPRRRLRAGPGTTLAALVPDAWLQATLTASAGPPAAQAQRVLGELATIYHERPGVAGRGILLALPPEGGQRPELARALTAALGSLPLIRPVTLSDLRRSVTVEPEPVRLDYPDEARARELPASYVAELRHARRALGSLDGVLVEDPATPARFDRLLLQAASVRYRADLAAGRALLSAVTSTVTELYAAIDVPETPAVTLTSVQGELPVTIRSRADVTLRVRVHLRTTRLEIEGGPTREIVLGPGDTQVLTLPVRALVPGGTAPVDVQVTDADGEVVLATGHVVVRSTAISVTAVLVVGGAALFLLVWLLQEAARRRRLRGTAPTTVPAGETSRSGVLPASARDGA